MVDYNYLNNLGKKKEFIPLKREITSSVQTSPTLQPNLQPQPQTLQPETQPIQNNQKQQFGQGGWLDKTLDILRIPEYGFSGFLQGNRQRAQELQTEAGKTGQTGLQKYGIGGFLDVARSGVKNIIPAIKQRTSFSSAPGNYNAGEAFGLQSGTGQDTVNAVSSLLVPTLAVGKIAKVLIKVPGIKQGTQILSKGGQIATDFAKKSPTLSRAIEVVSPYFRRPEVGKMLTETQRTIEGKLTNLYETLKTASKNLTPAEQIRIGQILEGGITSVEKLSERVKPVVDLTRKIADEAVDLGLLKPDYRKDYMTHIWEQTITGKKESLTNILSEIPKVAGTFWKERKNKEGYVRQFAPVLWKGLSTEIKDIGAVDLYKQLLNKFGQKMVKGQKLAQGFVDASKTISNQKIARYFKNTALPIEVVDYINRTLVKTNPNLLDKALNIWKAIKTVWNPAYHGRNLISNQILSDMQTGRGIFRTSADYMRAVKEYAGKGNQIFVDAAKEGGLIKKVNYGDALREFSQSAGLVKRNILRDIASKPRQLQTAMEETAKLNVFKATIQQLAKERGKALREVLGDKDLVRMAINKAEEAIFSPYRIGAQERSLASRTIPFYSFTRQALPFFIKTLINEPGRIVKYYRGKEIVENQSRQGELPSSQTPNYVKNLIRVGSKNGKNLYYDPTYTYPWGNFQETGGDRGSQLPFGLSANPFITAFFELGMNKNQYTGQPITTSNLGWRQFEDKLTYARRLLFPTFINTVIDKILPAFKGEKDYTGMEKNKAQAVLETLGIKTKTYNIQDLRSKARNAIESQINSLIKEYQQTGQNETSPERRNRILEDLRNEKNKLLRSQQ